MSVPEGDYEVALAGDRFRQVLDLANMLRGVDLSKLKELYAALQQITAATDTAGKVKAALSALAAIAAMTPTTTDDKIVTALRSVLTDDVIAIIARLVQQRTGTAAYAAAAIEADQVTLKAKGIPWGFVARLVAELAGMIAARVDG